MLRFLGPPAPCSVSLTSASTTLWTWAMAATSCELCHAALVPCCSLILLLVIGGFIWSFHVNPYKTRYEKKNLKVLKKLETSDHYIWEVLIIINNNNSHCIYFIFSKNTHTSAIIKIA